MSTNSQQQTPLPINKYTLLFIAPL